jgi:hypothetical protein
LVILILRNNGWQSPRLRLRLRNEETAQVPARDGVT